MAFGLRTVPPLGTLEGLRPLLLASPTPRAVATASMASLFAVDEQLELTLLDGIEADALELAGKIEQVGGGTIYGGSDVVIRGYSTW